MSKPPQKRRRFFLEEQIIKDKWLLLETGKITRKEIAVLCDSK